MSAADTSGPRTVITVTPVAWGLSSPGVITAALGGLVWWAAQHVHFVHRYEAVILAIVAGPAALVLGTRTWRWRSHQIRLTTLDIRSEGGILRRRDERIDLADIVATTIDRRGLDRLRRTGVVTVHTATTELALGPLRHPDALVRLIDAERRSLSQSKRPTMHATVSPRSSLTRRRAQRFRA